MPDATRLALLVLLLEPLAGCLSGELSSPTATSSVDEGASGTGTATSAIGGGPGCPEWGCGMNSPTLVDGVAFDELDPNGAQDRDGIRILGATLLGKPVKIHVDRHSLTAIALDGSGRVFTHGDLVGLIVNLQKAGQSYDLKVDGVDENSLRFWAGDRDEIVPFYRILVRPPAQDEFKNPVCRQDIAKQEPWWGPVEHSALAFAGDRYDPIQKTVADTQPGTEWFNLACAGTATAKIHLMRHTNAGAWTAGTWSPGTDIRSPAAPFHTARADRQAMIKMFSADYCGSGFPFTVDGQPLLYDATAPAYTPPSPVPPLVTGGVLSPASAVVEALWGPKGAMCLDVPRRPDLWDGRCSIPACGGPAGVVDWQTRAPVISAGWTPP